MTKAYLELNGLHKRYARGVQALAGLELRVSRGEILALLGPSGCGKTTTLRLIAGFERPDAGEIWLDGVKLADAQKSLPPERRRIGFVFQDHALFPHLTVLENVEFGLHGRSKQERREMARAVLSSVGLTIFEDRYPHELSGGQQQRVALARALAPEPALILLDEPFSSLDAGLREQTRFEVRRLLESLQTTALLVTHDQDEAMSFAERIALLRDGRLEQEGDPESVYTEPRTAFVASFLGRTNLVSGFATGVWARTWLGELPLSEVVTGPVLLSLRPEHFRFAQNETSLRVKILAREFKGHDVLFSVCSTADPRNELIIHADAVCSLRPGEEAWLSFFGVAVPVYPSFSEKRELP